MSIMYIFTFVDCWSLCGRGWREGGREGGEREGGREREEEEREGGKEGGGREGMLDLRKVTSQLHKCSLDNGKEHLEEVCQKIL